MISLIASPDQIVDECVTYITLNIDDELNQKQYKGLYINLIIKKVGTTATIPTYQQRYNGEPLIWEINKYTYKLPGTFQVTANVYDGPSFASCSFIVEEQFILRNKNIVMNMKQAPPNSRSVNFPKFTEQNVNASKVQVQGIDYFKTNDIAPVSKITTQEPSININKVQGRGRNVGPGGV
jgi:hypothetical protein